MTPRDGQTDRLMDSHCDIGNNMHSMQPNNNINHNYANVVIVRITNLDLGNFCLLIICNVLLYHVSSTIILT